MPRRHPPVLPERWLFTDARLGDALFTIAAHLPPGSGIVVRHDHLPPRDRWHLVRRLMRIATARRLTILLAGSPQRAARWGAHGVHLRQHQSAQASSAKRLGLILSMPVHNAKEARAARRARADIVFISPLHPTRSHQGADTLGIAAFTRLVRLGDARPVALGGMNAARGRHLRRITAQSGFVPGWAAIDHWWEVAAKRQRDQKRNCVPT